MRAQLKSIVTLWVGLLGGAGFVFLTQLVLARSLPVADMGALVGVMSLVALLVPIAEFGISGLWLRLFGQDSAAAQLWMKPTFRVVIMSSISMLLLMLAIGHVAWSTAVQRELLWWALILVPMEALVILAGARLQLEGRFVELSFWRALPKAFRLGVVLFAWQAGWDITAIILGYFISSVIILLLALQLLWPMLSGKIKWAKKTPSDDTRTKAGLDTTSRPRWGEIGKVALPFALGNFFSLIYLQSDIFMLSALHSAEAAGLYSVAFSLIALAFLLPSAIFQQFLLPRYHRWAVHDKAKMLTAYRLGNGYMIVVGLITMALLIWIAPYLVEGVFGQKYASAGQVTQYLALCIPFRFLASSVGCCLTTGNNMRHKMKYQMLTALVNVALNLVLIPKYGIYGAAVATVACEVLLCAAYLYGTRKYIFEKEALRGWSLNYKLLMK